MTLKFDFNKIYIIESLFEDEIKTGKHLYDDLIRWKTLDNHPLYSEFFELNNIEEFDRVMNQINADVKNGYSPFIHFEIHGSENRNGFVLRSGQLLSWDKVAAHTRKINISAKNNLIISLATCFGAYFLYAIDINNVTPFSCCISTTEIITTEEIEQDFTSFFDTILDTTSFNAAIDALNKSNKNPNKYHFFSAEEFLEMILKRLESSDFNPKRIEYRLWVNSLTKKLRLMNAEYADAKKKYVKAVVRKQLLDQGSMLRKEARNTFLKVP